MKQKFLIRKGNKQLLLFFAGWGMDENPFRQIQPADYDWMICYDYRSLEFDENLVEGYTYIISVAWSMGVWAASQVIKQHPSLPLSKQIAINGTLYPINETMGIAPCIFDATLQGLNEQTLLKFQRRMCNSSNEYKAFREVAPQRPASELKEELMAIQEQARTLPPALYPWHKAIIGKNDYIFLTHNQRLGWESLANSIVIVEAAHYQIELFKDIFHHTPKL